MKPSEKEIISNTVPADGRTTSLPLEVQTMKYPKEEIIRSTVPNNEKLTSSNTHSSPSKEVQYKIHVKLKEPRLEIKTPEAPKKPKPTKIIVLKPPTRNDEPKKKSNNKNNKQQTKTTNNKKTSKSKQDKTSTSTSNNIMKYFKNETTRVPNITSAENKLHITPTSEQRTMTSKDADSEGGPVECTNVQRDEVVSSQIMSLAGMAPHSSDGRSIVQSKHSIKVSNQSESDLTQNNKVFTSKHLGEKIMDQMNRGLED